MMPWEKEIETDDPDVAIGKIMLHLGMGRGEASEFYQAVVLGGDVVVANGSDDQADDEDE